MRKTINLSVALTFGFFVSGCGLNFGDDYEKDVSSFNRDDLKTVENRFRLTMPTGTRGLNLVYTGSGIDDSLIARLEIPAAAMAGLEKQILELKGGKVTVAESLASGQAWWDPAPLTVRLRKKLTIKSDYLELILGEEKSGRGILLLKWFET